MNVDSEERQARRTAIARHVQRRLADREFAERLVADPDSGNKVVLVALFDDSVSRLVGQIEAAGRAVNVFVGVPAGIVAVSFETVDSETSPRGSVSGDGEVSEVSRDCTVGVLLAQLESWTGGSRIIRFVDGGPSSPQSCRARVVAFA